jgi:hypothetical protein
MRSGSLQRRWKPPRKAVSATAHPELTELLLATGEGYQTE